jgi:hypothetical protein
VDQGTWATDAGVGANEVVYTLDLTCPNTSFVCDLIDGYSEQDVSTVTGAGTLQLDDAVEQFQFDSDSSQDVGSGLQPAYATLTGTDVVFPNIAFAGVPEITDILVFALSNPQIAAPGLDLSTPGDHAFSQTISYSGSGLVIGDLEFLLGPAIVVPPDDIVVSGTFRALGDVGNDGTLDYEIRDMTATFSLQNATTIGGEAVSVDVTADMTLNLAGEVDSGAIPAVPGLGPLGLAALATLLGGVARGAFGRAPAA